MRRWYSERRTALGRWAPQTTPEAPHGGAADHPGEITVRTNSGPVRLRRIFRVPEGFEAASLEDLRQAAVDAERRPCACTGCRRRSGRAASWLTSLITTPQRSASPA